MGILRDAVSIVCLTLSVSIFASALLVGWPAVTDLFALLRGWPGVDGYMIVARIIVFWLFFAFAVGIETFRRRVVEVSAPHGT